MIDFDLCVCKLHIDVARRAAEFAARAAEEEEMRERGELERSGEDADDPAELAVSSRLCARVGKPLHDASSFGPPVKKLSMISDVSARSHAAPAHAIGINMEIPDGPIISDRAKVKDALPAGLPPPPPPAPAKPAPWAAAIDGTNQKKARDFAADNRFLDTCPICFENKATVQMKPCDHSCCGVCLDQWMSQRSSFAQTLRNGSSVTTCPLCRGAVLNTLTAQPKDPAALTQQPEAAQLSRSEWQAKTKQRQEELNTMQHAHAAELAQAETPGSCEDGVNGLPALTSGMAVAGWQMPSGGFGASCPLASCSNGLPSLPMGAASHDHGASKIADGASASQSVSSGGSSAQSVDNSPTPPGLGPSMGWVSEGFPATAPKSSPLSKEVPSTAEDTCIDVMEARLAAVMLDELDSEIFGDSKVPPSPASPSVRQQLREEDCRAHSAWLDAQAAATHASSVAGSTSPGCIRNNGSSTSLNEAATSSTAPAEGGSSSGPPPGLAFPVGKNNASLASNGDLWGTGCGDAFGASMWGGCGTVGSGFGLSSLIENEEAQAARQGVEAEAAWLCAELDAALERMKREQRRAEQAEARAEGLQIQVSALQEDLRRTRSEHRAKSEEFERLRDEHLSLLKAEQDAKKSIASMCEQLEQKDHELGALQHELHQQSSMQGPVFDHGAVAFGNAPHPHPYNNGHHYYPVQQMNQPIMGSHLSHQQQVQQAHHHQQQHQLAQHHAFSKQPPHQSLSPGQSSQPHLQASSAPSQSTQPQPSQPSQSSQLAQASQQISKAPGSLASQANALSQANSSAQTPGSLQATTNLEYPPPLLRAPNGATPQQAAQLRERAAQLTQQLSTSRSSSCAPGASGAGGAGWKCLHCTFFNHSTPILDPQTKRHKGFCEICEGVTTLE